MHGSSSGSENSTKRVVLRNGNVFNDAIELLFESPYVLVSKGIEGIVGFTRLEETQPTCLQVRCVSALDLKCYC